MRIAEIEEDRKISNAFTSTIPDRHNIYGDNTNQKELKQRDEKQ